MKPPSISATALSPSRNGRGTPATHDRRRLRGGLRGHIRLQDAGNGRPHGPCGLARQAGEEKVRTVIHYSEGDQSYSEILADLGSAILSAETSIGRSLAAVKRAALGAMTLDELGHEA